MDHKKRHKLCPHCEGSVDLDVIVCPYCGKDVTDQKMMSQMQTPMSQRDSLVRSLSPNETLSSLYPPPYRPKVYDDPAFQDTPQDEIAEERVLENEEVIQKEEAPSQTKTSLLPIIFFSLGVNLFLFGLFLTVFSKNGEIWLHWKNHMGLAYLAVAIPFLYFGYKKLK